MKKFAVIAIALLVVAGGGYWSYKAGVWDGVISQQPSSPSGITYAGEDGKTALEILKNKYRVETQTFSGSEFVESIDGVTPRQGQYWSFIVNGQEATVGAGHYTTKSGDTIEWQLRDVNSSL